MPVVLAGVLALAAGLPAGAQTDPATAAPVEAAPADTAEATPLIASAIVTLDQDRLFAESAFGKAMRARQESESAALLSENRRIEAALEQEERDLTARRAGMAAADFAELADAFDAKVEDIRKAQEAKGRAIARKGDADRQTFISSAVPVLGDLMRELGAVAIIDKSALVLSLSAIDITTPAVARLDAVLGDGSVPPADTPTPDTPTPDPATPDPTSPDAPDPATDPQPSAPAEGP